MRFLLLTYCIELSRGQLQIGVYKRGLRVALELSARGHEVVFYCTGHENFHDDLTARAKSQMKFIDLAFRKAEYEGAEANRATFLAELGTLRPDVVVIGEAPMAGPMLEMTLCAVEARIPVVILDNAYHPKILTPFCQRHGAMVDGIVLSGPSVLHGKTGYRYVIQVPPYVDVSVPEARALLEAELDAVPDRLLLVLGYDPNVEQLGLSLVRRLDDPGVTAVFVSPDPAETQRRLDSLADGARGRTRAIAPPSDQVLFGLLRLARCAVTKCGYMQVTESLSLGTPVVTLYYPGFFSLIAMPPAALRFAHATTSPEADTATVSAARRFLGTAAAALRAVHDGSLGAASRTADFLEALPRTPRADATEESVRLGFTPRRIEAALSVLGGWTNPVVQEVRAAHLREFPDHEIYVVACRYGVGGETRFARLWGRRFRRPLAVKRAMRQARAGDPRRRVLFASPRDRIMLELDLGEEVLPSVVEMMAAERRAADG